MCHICQRVDQSQWRKGSGGKVATKHCEVIMFKRRFSCLMRSVFDVDVLWRKITFHHPGIWNRVLQPIWFVCSQRNTQWDCQVHIQALTFSFTKKYTGPKLTRCPKNCEALGIISWRKTIAALELWITHCRFINTKRNPCYSLRASQEGVEYCLVQGSSCEVSKSIRRGRTSFCKQQLSEIP